MSMSSVTIKRNVLLRAIVNPKLREDLGAELQNASDEVEQRIQQIDFQTRAYITDLQRTNLQQAMAVRKQVDAEKKRQQELQDALQERKAAVEVLQDGDEIVRGTLESFVEITEGDNIAELLGGVEIVTQDDLVIEIRHRTDLDEGETSVAQLIEEVRSQAAQS
jgi:hypothetical protein